MTRIGVLTGGGDVPGLNPCIRTLVYAAADRGYEVLGLRRGWAGLLDYNLDTDEPQDHCVQPLAKRDVRTMDRTGCTFLHTSRTNQPPAGGCGRGRVPGAARVRVPRADAVAARP